MNNAPVVAGAVTLAAIAEDSGARLITQAELLGNASDVDGPSLTAANLAIAIGSGSLVNNNDGTWSYTPALNDDTSERTPNIVRPAASAGRLEPGATIPDRARWKK